ncbi:MAG TPA: M42 family metallopeptidase [bacterium]
MTLLDTLCTAYGPSGREDKVRQIIENEVGSLGVEIKTDPMGNLICRRSPKAARARGKKIMFCAHMDEIGVIVTHIDKNGFLRFTGVGGVFPEHIPYQHVIFESGLTGVIGLEPRRDQTKPLLLENMYIDIGARDKDDALKNVRIGDIAAFNRSASRIGDRFTGKALDDRVGCFCLIETLKRLKKNDNDLYFVFSVQEEVGLRGARTGAYAIEPAYAIAVDVTLTGDAPEAEKMEVGLGKGTAIKVKDSSFIAHPVVKDKLVSIADRLKIPYQLEVLNRGTTDAAVIQLIKEGVVSGVVSIPTRYVHTTCETCDLGDVDWTIKLITAVAESGLE